MLSYVIPTLLYCTLELYWNLLSQVKDFLPSPLPTQQTPNFWRIRQNDWLLKLEGWEPWLPPSLSSTAPCSNLAHWPCLLFIRQTPVACCILSWVQSSTVLHALPTTERHWLCPEKIQEKLQNNLKSSQVLKAVDANSQIPGKKKKKGQESFHYEFQCNCLLVWSSLEVLVIGILPLFQLIDIWSRGHCI